ncbi:hypothetical protein ESY86_12030 [Subsaximicrobium wynnwilliamsii]|jgi:hypothetical protein|uniref:Uncharacterized protein n=1 Tax=Subsaximicrobium wynnwilliamsii TaxID=291179 RepID=A0A5C6ZJ58_9FLAO|nr:hypothetical protein [Subsaximicrobium wynnwilliamsii]TXD82967.1 hypothetical protein ESY87_12065 [Subsaximicrobium wynnwilliamsii]TXD88688.1 hypothetical protein ESY86_12030 [Subsaximicrobium wynnwilliamsii]TXE02781.1 hypothetical protein ESY88_11085 [Subsaximicrobium wynnwilliamsii]
MNSFISLPNLILVSATQLTIVLIITATIFAIFIGAAVIKMFKLKAESKRLLDNSTFKKDVDKSYKDFTDSHLYDSNN